MRPMSSVPPYPKGLTSRAETRVPAGRMTGKSGNPPAAVRERLARHPAGPRRITSGEDHRMGSVIKKRRKRMAKKKHRKLLRKTRVARRKAGK